MAGAREHASGHLLLACRCWRLPQAPRASPRNLPDPLELSPVPLPSSGPLFLSRPSTTVSTARCPRGHRAPLASPSSPRAPPPSPASLHQLARCRMPCLALYPAIFVVSAPRSPATSHHRQPLPELTKTTVDCAVCSSAFPLSPRAFCSP